MIFSKKGELAIKPIHSSKVEIDPGTGFARAKARTKVIYADLMFAYEYNGKIFEPGKAKIILPGEASLKPWAKKEYETLSGESFVICPESDVVGFAE